MELVDSHSAAVKLIKVSQQIIDELEQKEEPNACCRLHYNAGITSDIATYAVQG